MPYTDIDTSRLLYTIRKISKHQYLWMKKWEFPVKTVYFLNINFEDVPTFFSEMRSLIF